jgi:hypothetical protein
MPTLSCVDLSLGLGHYTRGATNSVPKDRIHLAPDHDHDVIRKSKYFITLWVLVCEELISSVSVSIYLGSLPLVKADVVEWTLNVYERQHGQLLVFQCILNSINI